MASLPFSLSFSLSSRVVRRASCVCERIFPYRAALGKAVEVREFMSLRRSLGSQVHVSLNTDSWFTALGTQPHQTLAINRWIIPSGCDLWTEPCHWPKQNAAVKMSKASLTLWIFFFIESGCTWKGEKTHTASIMPEIPIRNDFLARRAYGMNIFTAFPSSLTELFRSRGLFPSFWLAAFLCCHDVMQFTAALSELKRERKMLQSTIFIFNGKETGNGEKKSYDFVSLISFHIFITKLFV